MALPDAVRQNAEESVAKYCRNKVPQRFWNELRVSYAVRGNTITIFEDRPRYNNPLEWGHLAVAQFRFDPARESWSLYWRDRHERWHPYAGLRRPKTVDPLLREVDRDPTGIFWG